MKRSQERFSLGVDASAARYSEITLVNNVTGKVKTYSELSEEVSNLPDPAQNGTAKRTLELGETEWESYTLNFKATRAAVSLSKCGGFHRGYHS